MTEHSTHHHRPVRGERTHARTEVSTVVHGDPPRFYDARSAPAAQLNGTPSDDRFLPPNTVIYGCVPGGNPRETAWRAVIGPAGQPLPDRTPARNAARGQPTQARRLFDSTGTLDASGNWSTPPDTHTVIHALHADEGTLCQVIAVPLDQDFISSEEAFYALAHSALVPWHNGGVPTRSLPVYEVRKVVAGPDQTAVANAFVYLRAAPLHRSETVDVQSGAVTNASDFIYGNFFRFETDAQGNIKPDQIKWLTYDSASGRTPVGNTAPLLLRIRTQQQSGTNLRWDDFLAPRTRARRKVYVAADRQYSIMYVYKSGTQIPDETFLTAFDRNISRAYLVRLNEQDRGAHRVVATPYIEGGYLEYPRAIPDRSRWGHLADAYDALVELHRVVHRHADEENGVIKGHASAVADYFDTDHWLGRDLRSAPPQGLTLSVADFGSFRSDLSSAKSRVASWQQQIREKASSLYSRVSSAECVAQLGEFIRRGYTAWASQFLADCLQLMSHSDGNAMPELCASMAANLSGRPSPGGAEPGPFAPLHAAVIETRRARAREPEGAHGEARPEPAEAAHVNVVEAVKSTVETVKAFAEIYAKHLERTILPRMERAAVRLEEAAHEWDEILEKLKGEHGALFRPSSTPGTVEQGLSRILEDLQRHDSLKRSMLAALRRRNLLETEMVQHSLNQEAVENLVHDLDALKGVIETGARGFAFIDTALLLYKIRTQEVWTTQGALETAASLTSDLGVICGGVVAMKKAQLAAQLVASEAAQELPAAEAMVNATALGKGLAKGLVGLNLAALGFSVGRCMSLYAEGNWSGEAVSTFLSTAGSALSAVAPFAPPPWDGVLMGAGVVVSLASAFATVTYDWYRVTRYGEEYVQLEAFKKRIALSTRYASEPKLYCGSVTLELGDSRAPPQIIAGLSFPMGQEFAGRVLTQDGVSFSKSIYAVVFFHDEHTREALEDGASKVLLPLGDPRRLPSRAQPAYTRDELFRAAAIQLHYQESRNAFVGRVPDRLVPLQTWANPTDIMDDSLVPDRSPVLMRTDVAYAEAVLRDATNDHKALPVYAQIFVLDAGADDSFGHLYRAYLGLGGNQAEFVGASGQKALVLPSMWGQPGNEYVVTDPDRANVAAAGAPGGILSYAGTRVHRGE